MCDSIYYILFFFPGDVSINSSLEILIADIILRTIEFFSGFSQRAPVFAPFTTPIYSNTAFRILSYAMENITGKAFASSLDDKIIKPLNLSRTSLHKPGNDAFGVIPFNATTSGWLYDLGDEGP